MKIVVVGGTGLIGSKIVSRLGGHGHEVVAASPSTGVNAVTGEGLAEAVSAASAVIDVSRPPPAQDATVLEFFATGTRNLLAAAADAGVGHHVALSIVGVGRLPDSGYFQAKHVQEQLIEASPIPFSIVRATQFHEFVRTIADATTDDGTVRMPPVGFQPVAGADVARVTSEIAVGAPLNGRVEVAGPERFRMDEFFRNALGAWGDPREVVTDPDARYFGAELADDSLVPEGDTILGATGYPA